MEAKYFILSLLVVGFVLLVARAFYAWLYPPSSQVTSPRVARAADGSHTPTLHQAAAGLRRPEEHGSDDDDTPARLVVLGVMIDQAMARHPSDPSQPVYIDDDDIRRDDSDTSDTSDTGNF